MYSSSLPESYIFYPAFFFILSLALTTLSAEKTAKIASYFGVSVDYLLGNESAPDGPPAPSRPGSKWIPVLGRVAAGTPIEAVEDILDYEEIDAHTAASGEHFALQIKGQSMEPRIKDGDVVIVQKQDDCDSGDVAVVLVSDLFRSRTYDDLIISTTWLIPSMS